MTEDAAPSGPQDWLSLPDVAERLNVPVTKARQMLRDRKMQAVRHDGVLRVPVEFVGDGVLLKGLTASSYAFDDAAHTLTGFDGDAVLDTIQLARTDELAFWYAQADRSRTDRMSENLHAMVSVHRAIPTWFVAQQFGSFLAPQDKDRSAPGIMCFPLYH